MPTVDYDERVRVLSFSLSEQKPNGGMLRADGTIIGADGAHEMMVAPSFPSA